MLVSVMAQSWMSNKVISEQRSMPLYEARLVAKASNGNNNLTMTRDEKSNCSKVGRRRRSVMITIGNAPCLVENATERQKPGKTIFHSSMLGYI